MLLSIVLAGRNDGYLTDYLYRLETTINQYSVSIPDDSMELLELIVVDWGSEVPLCDVISLTPKAQGYTKFLEVPRKLAGDVFDQITAINVGIRRAEGEFIMLSDSDCVYTPYSLNQLFAILSKQRSDLPVELENHIFNISRVQVPESFVQRRPGYQAIQQNISKIANNLKIEGNHLQALGGYAGAQLMTKKMWQRMRGFIEDENFGWGASDNDITLRVCKEGDWHNLAQFGVICYHLNHSSISKADTSSSFLSQAKAVSQTRSHKFSEKNNPNWGMANETFSFARSRAPTLDVGQYLNKGLDGLGVASSIEKQHPEAKIRPVLRYATPNFNLDLIINFNKTRQAFQNEVQQLQDISLTILKFAYAECPHHCLIDLKDNEKMFEVLTNLLCDMDYYAIRAFEGIKDQDLDEAFQKMSRVLGSYEVNGKTLLVRGDKKTAQKKINSWEQKQFDLILLNNDFFTSAPEKTLNSVWEKLSVNGLLCISCKSDEKINDLRLIFQENLHSKRSNIGVVSNMINLFNGESNSFADFDEKLKEPCLLRADASGVIYARKTDGKLFNRAFKSAYQ